MFLLFLRVFLRYSLVKYVESNDFREFIFLDIFVYNYWMMFMNNWFLDNFLLFLNYNFMFFYFDKEENIESLYTKVKYKEF